MNPFVLPCSNNMIDCSLALFSQLVKEKENQFYSASKLILCHILHVAEGLGKYILGNKTKKQFMTLCQTKESLVDK